MKYRKEEDLYPEVKNWLYRFLRGRFPRAEIITDDTHSVPLNEYMKRQGIGSLFGNQQWHTYEIQVDVAGFVIYKKRQELALVECKLDQLTPSDLAQLLLYSRVALPLFSFLVSPAGLSGSLNNLLLTYGRLDILEYYSCRGEQPRRIILGRWSSRTKALVQGSVVPKGSMGRL